VVRILGDPALKQRLEQRAYAYGREMSWPAIGKRVLALMRDVLDAREAGIHPEPVATA